MLSKQVLEALYCKKHLSVNQIASNLGVSEGQINYWLKRHGIKKRSISDAIYQKWNPHGNPFLFTSPKSIKDAMLYGIGIGLYWGEGTKSHKNSVRLANSDPRIIRTFMLFLERIYGVDRKRIHFGLQIFGDMPEDATVLFWLRALNVQRNQFYKKIIVTPYRGVGNYRKKTEHGVITLYFNNKKLRDIMCSTVDSASSEVVVPR